MNESLTYDDVTLVAEYFDGDSRGNLDTTVTLGNHTFKHPAIPANMVCCISKDLALTLSELGYFYVMHRFMPKEELKAFVKKCNEFNMKTISISLGVKSDDYEFIEWWFNETNLRIDFITIDIAHGHCRKMKEMIKHIKSHSTESRKPFVIAGNVMTKVAVDDLESWGADCAKVGIELRKSMCTTKLQTGFHSPMFSTVKKCSSDDTEFVKYSEIHNQIKDELKNLKTEKTFDPVTKCYKINSNLPWVDLISVREYDFLSKAEQSECFRHNDSVWVKGNSVTEEINRRLNRKKSSIPIIADGGIRHQETYLKLLLQVLIWL